MKSLRNKVVYSFVAITVSIIAGVAFINTNAGNNSVGDPNVTSLKATQSAAGVSLTWNYAHTNFSCRHVFRSIDNGITWETVRGEACTSADGTPNKSKVALDPYSDESANLGRGGTYLYKVTTYKTTQGDDGKPVYTALLPETITEPITFTSCVPNKDTQTKLVCANFAGVNLANKTFEVPIYNSDFTGANLSGTHFYGRVNGSNFTNANLANVNFIGDVTYSAFVRAYNLTKLLVTFSGNVDGVIFTDANLAQGYFRGDVSRSTFTNAKLVSSEIDGNTSHSTFTNADLASADFRGPVDSSQFTNAYSSNLLAQTTFEEDVNDSTFINANLHGYFRGEINNSTFTNANFTSTEFDESINATSFTNVVLIRGYFRADINGSTFSNVDLTNAEIDESIRDSQFTNAILTGVQYRGRSIKNSSFNGSPRID
jgi:uncharacterized protein YjbI with pentapeptide repeats